MSLFHSLTHPQLFLMELAVQANESTSAAISVVRETNPSLIGTIPGCVAGYLSLTSLLSSFSLRYCCCCVFKLASSLSPLSLCCLLQPSNSSPHFISFSHLPSLPSPPRSPALPPPSPSPHPSPHHGRTFRSLLFSRIQSQHRSERGGDNL